MSVSPRRPAPPSPRISSTSDLPSYRRPGSAPTKRFDARAHQQLVYQLQSVLSAATSEHAPTPRAKADAERRIRLLQKVLQDTKAMGEEVREEAEVEHNQRYCEAEREKLAREASIQAMINTRDPRIESQREQQREATAMLLTHRRKVLERRTASCHRTVEENRNEFLASCQRREQEREKRLDEVAASRAQLAKFMRKVLEEREAHATEIQAHKEWVEAESSRIKQQQYEAHREAAENAAKRRQAAQQERIETAKRRQEHAVEHHHQKYYAVTPRPPPPSAPNTVQHEYVAYKAKRRELKLQKHEQRYEEIVNERIRRAHELMEDVRHKRAMAEAAHSRRQLQGELQGQAKTIEVLRHQQRVREEADRREQERLTNHYTKWSERADVVTQHLLEQYQAMSSAFEEGAQENEESAP